MSIAVSGANRAFKLELNGNKGRGSWIELFEVEAEGQHILTIRKPKQIPEK